jgi:hypothetical protein
VNPIYGETLYHYGIKGQKWGVKRYQNADRTWTDEGKIRYGRNGTLVKRRQEAEKAGKRKKSIETSSAGNENIAGKTKSIAGNTKSIDPKIKKKLNEKSRLDDTTLSLLASTAASSAGIMGTASMLASQYGVSVGTALKALAAANPEIPIMTAGLGLAAAVKIGGAVKSHYDNKKYTQERENNPVDKKTGFHIKSIDMTDEEDLKRINPEKNNFNQNTKSNCMLCTVAYEMRKRGYDVKSGKASYGYDEGDLKKWFPEIKVKTVNNEYGSPSSNYAEKVIESIEKLSPEGSRGNLMLSFPYNGRHSVIYQIKNGKMMILDGQINKIYTDPRNILSRCSNVAYARMDNVAFDLKSIKECCL